MKTTKTKQNQTKKQEKEEMSPYITAVIGKKHVPTVSVVYLLNKLQAMMQAPGETFLELTNPGLRLANELDRLVVELYNTYETMTKQDDNAKNN